MVSLNIAMPLTRKQILVEEEATEAVYEYEYDAEDMDDGSSGQQR